MRRRHVLLYLRVTLHPEFTYQYVLEGEFNLVGYSYLLHTVSSRLEALSLSLHAMRLLINSFQCE